MGTLIFMETPICIKCYTGRWLEFQVIEDVDGQCVPCVKGLSCPIGSTIAGLTLPSANVSNDVERPFINPGSCVCTESLLLSQPYKREGRTESNKKLQ